MHVERTAIELYALKWHWNEEVLKTRVINYCQSAEKRISNPLVLRLIAISACQLSYITTLLTLDATDTDSCTKGQVQNTHEHVERFSFNAHYD